MKNLLLTSILVFTANAQSAFAQTDFLTEAQAAKVNRYMDDICPDTYCGGDISFYTQGLSCAGNTCTLELTGSGYSDFDNAAVASSANTKKITSEYKNVAINFGAMEISGVDEDGFEGASFNFSCTMSDLPMDLKKYGDKEDLVYDLVVWGCIRELESIVYNY